MNSKKTPLWLMILLGTLGFFSCLGFMFLTVASMADPELYATLTDPFKSFASQTLEDISIGVVNTQEKLNEAANETSEYLSEKIEEQKQEIKTGFNDYLDSLVAGVNVEPEHQGLSPALLSNDAPIAEYSTTHFEGSVETGDEFITGGTHKLHYFNQTDEQWGNYGTDSIRGYGCGPTAMTMIVNTLTEDYYSPQEMADIFVAENFWCKSSGTYYSFAYGSGVRFDLDVTSYVPEELTATTLLQHLMSGKLAIALMGPGHFTNGGHYIVLRGATLTGEVLVADPADRDRSITLWDPQVIIDELSSVRSSGGPLWFFAPAEPVYEEEDSMLVGQEP